MSKALVISCFDWYEKRLRPIVELLSNKYEVTVLTSDFNHIEKKKYNTKLYDCEYIHVPSYKSNVSIKRIISHFCFGNKINKRINDLKPDYIYFLLPPNNIARHIIKYKMKNKNVKVVADVIDLWPESFPFGHFEKTFILKKWRSWREIAMEYSDAVVVECDYYKSKIKTTSPVYTLYVMKQQNDNEKIYFGKNIDKWAEINTQRLDCGELVLGYVGSINNIIDIDEIVRVVKSFSDNYKVEINIIGDGVSRKLFIQKLEEVGAKVNYYGIIFDETSKMEILGKCHYGINMMKESVSVGLTIKSIDYFSYGLPVINNIKGDTWKMIEEKNIGINILKFEEFEKTQEKDWNTYRKSIRKIYEEKFSYDAVEKNISKIVDL